MPSLRLVHPHNSLLSPSLPQQSLLSERERPRAAGRRRLSVHEGSEIAFRKRSHFPVRAVENDSQQFEVDQEKAREALQQLDQLLQSLSQKRAPTPKIKASDVKLAASEQLAREEPEISGSFLTYAAVALLLFTFLYNLVFYNVIKPSIDGPDYVPELETPISKEGSEAVDSLSVQSPPLLQGP